MQINPIESAINTFDAPTLQGFDVESAQVGQRIRGSSRQFVRFFNHTESEIYATKVKVNEKTGSTQVLETAVRDRTREFVEIVTPGDKNSPHICPAEDYHKREYWPQYKAFRDGATAPLGLSVDEASFIPQSVATELLYLGCQTVEQLADASDILCERIPHGYTLREQAKTAVKATAQNKESGRLLTLQSELEKSQALIREMSDRLAAVEANKAQKLVQKDAK